MLGDKCPKCKKRATPLKEVDKPDPERWMHCPRCGITFNKNSKSIQEIRDALPGNALAKKFKK